MAMVVLVLKIYLIATVCVLLIYSMRHFLFTVNRLYMEQRIYYQDIYDSELKPITILIPMHNEETVAGQILDALVDVDYPHELLQIIPINDFSEDGTGARLDAYAARYPFITPLHRDAGERGKPAALNEGLAQATGAFVIVFDADYLPPRGIVKNIVSAFHDPEVGAVMGRVVPVNTRANILTRLLDMERTGGYQVDQQARYNLKLIPQYGGTVGGFRREVVLALGGFVPKLLAEDTELTYRLLINGWKVIYSNRAECYEEVPEAWAVRASQIRRWSRGHNQVMLRYLWPLVTTPLLSTREKLDGMLLLCVYAIPLLQMLALADGVALFFLGKMDLMAGALAFLFVGAYNTFGNFAPFYQIGTATLLDGARQRILLLPMLLFSYLFNTWYITLGSLEAVVDTFSGRKAQWRKTKRFRKPRDTDAAREAVQGLYVANKR